MTFLGASEELLCVVRDRVAYVTINRPARRNALNFAIQRQIPELMSELGNSEEVLAIVIRGAGEVAFSAGGDIKEMNEAASEGKQITLPMQGAYRNPFEAILETPKPTIASVNGLALGGGFELVLACDLRIASYHATFGMPEVRVGMGANFGSVLLPRLLPRAVAIELLYTGDSMSAERALQLGLINRVAFPGKLDEEAEELVRKVVNNAPMTLLRYKEMLLKGWELPIQSALRLNVGPNPYTSLDRIEGARAFLEKRAPHWLGK